MQQTPGQRGSQWTIKLPSSDCYPYPAGPRVVAVTEAELWALQQHGHAARRGGGERGAAVQDHQQRHKHRPAPASANAVMAGSYYPSAMHPSGGPAAMGAVYWQHFYEDPYAGYRGPVAEPIAFHQVMPQVWSFTPWRIQRQKLPFMPARHMAVTCADEPQGGGHEPGDQAAGYQQPNDQGQQQQQPYHQPQENWGQDEDYEDEGEAPDNNGQGDGDGPSQFGGDAEGGASDDAAVVLEEQDQVVALLVAVDARHEKQLAFERVLQERYSAAWWKRHSRQRFHLRSATSAESLDVIVKAALWRSVSDKCIYDSVREERLYSPVGPRTRALSFCAGENDDDACTDDAGSCCSPTVILNLHLTSSSVSQVEAEEANEPVVVISGPEAAGAVDDTAKKEAADATGAQEKTKPLTAPSALQPKQNACFQQAQEQQPPQRRDVPPPMTGYYQQRRPPEYRRSYARREYHSTRRYESDHMPPPPPPPPPQERPPGSGRQARNEILPPHNGRYRDTQANNRAINQQDPSYAKFQQEHRSGYSDSRNRNRSNRHANGHQWNRNNGRSDASDFGNRGGGHRNSLPYYSRKITGATGVSNPANSETPPPPQPRGRHYNRQKEGVSQAQGHHQSGRPSPQRGAVGNREAVSGNSRAPTSTNGARPPAHQRAAAANDAPPSSRNRRPPRSEFNHPRVGAAGEATDGPPPKPCESIPARGDGDAALAPSTDHEQPAEAERRPTREHWERSNVCRRRTSQ